MPDFNWNAYEKVSPAQAPDGFNWGAYEKVNSPQGAAQPQPQRSLLDETWRKAAATIGTVGKSVLNLPNNLSAGFLPPIIDKDLDYYKAYGVGENLGDKIAAGALEFAVPFGAANKLNQAAKWISKPLQTNVLGGAGYGAIKDEENRLGGALEGGTYGVGAYAASKALSALGKPVGNYITERLAKPLLQKAANKVGYENLPAWAQTFTAARNNYQGAQQAENAAWNALDKNIPTGKFNPETTTKAATEALSPLLSRIEKNPNLAESYAPSIKNLQNMIEKPPQTGAEALDRLHDLNAAMSNFERATKTKDLFLNKTVGNLKKQLQDDIKQSFPEMGEALVAANKSTVSKQRLKDIPRASGVLKQNPEIANFLKNGNLPDEAILRNYLPKEGQTGLEQMKKFADVVGNEAVAKQALQRYALRDSFSEGVPDLNKLLKTYQSYSPVQRNYLFTKEQNSFLSKASKADVMRQNKGGKNWYEWYLNHKLFGLPGVAADIFGGKQAAKWFANPKGADWAMKTAEKGFYQPQGYLNNILLQGAPQ